MTIWQASKPANIALIKYMGKVDASTNQPTNASLSYALPSLQTTVTLEDYHGTTDKWAPLDKHYPSPPPQTNTTFIFIKTPPETSHAPHPFKLNDQAKGRFLKHLHLIKKTLGYHGCFIVRSRNNFPLSCGLASSASSFAALTECAVKAICEKQQKPLSSLTSLASLSQKGSGSSCRSFFSPWAIWNKEGASPIDLPYRDLKHAIIIVSTSPKAVSSSQAHRRVLSSPLFAGRSERAETRLNALLHALKQENWQAVFKLVWDEFNDMHSLFTTAQPAFHYTTPKLSALLDYLKALWDKTGDGPLITMDAGPNIHLLFRKDQDELLDSLQHQLPL